MRTLTYDHSYTLCAQLLIHCMKWEEKKNMNFLRKWFQCVKSNTVFSANTKTERYQHWNRSHVLYFINTLNYYHQIVNWSENVNNKHVARFVSLFLHLSLRFVLFFTFVIFSNCFILHAKRQRPIIVNIFFFPSHLSLSFASLSYFVLHQTDAISKSSWENKFGVKHDIRCDTNQFNEKKTL